MTVLETSDDDEAAEAICRAQLDSADEAALAEVAPLLSHMAKKMRVERERVEEKVEEPLPSSELRDARRKWAAERERVAAVAATPSGTLENGRLLALDMGYRHMGACVLDGRGRVHALDHVRLVAPDPPRRAPPAAALDCPRPRRPRGAPKPLKGDALVSVAFEAFVEAVPRYLPGVTQVVIERVCPRNHVVHALGCKAYAWLSAQPHLVVAWGNARRKLASVPTADRPRGNKRAAVDLAAQLLWDQPEVRRRLLADPKADDMADAYLMGLSYL